MLVQELQKPMIKKFERWKVYSRYEDIVLAIDLAEMGSLSSLIAVLKFIVCDRCFHQICVGSTFDGYKPFTSCKNS